MLGQANKKSYDLCFTVLKGRKAGNILNTVIKKCWCLKGEASVILKLLKGFASVLSVINIRKVRHNYTWYCLVAKSCPTLLQPRGL